MAQLFFHHFKQLPGAGRGDLLDCVAGELAVTDGEIPIEPNLLGLVAGLNRRATVSEFQFLRLSLRETKPEAEIVGQVRSAHRDHPRGVPDAISVEHKIRGARADVDREHSVLAFFGRRHHVAGRQTREDELPHLEIKAPDHMNIVRESLLLAVNGPITDL